MKKAALAKIYADFAAAFPGTETVFGSGAPDTDVLFVGEAPGRDEVRLGQAFVGPAGRNLNSFLELAGISRDDIYITNAIKYRLSRPGARAGTLANRPAAREDIMANLPYLLREIELLDPECIVTLGNVPLRAVMGGSLPSGGIGAAHGRPVSVDVGGRTRTVFPLYHPAGIIYNRALVTACEEDFRSLKAYLSNSQKSIL